MKEQNDLFDLAEALFLAKDPLIADQMAAYMRDHFEFLGIKTPKRRQLCRTAFAKASATGEISWDFVFFCWQQPYREFQYIACDYLIKLKKYLTLTDLPKLKELVANKAWWDTVDTLAKLFTELYLRYPVKLTKVMLTWSMAEDIWLKRVALELQLLLKEKTDTRLLAQIIENNLGSDEFFINKAIGWALRDYSKTDPKWVKAYIITHQAKLNALSIREGSKYLK